MSSSSSSSTQAAISWVSVDPRNQQTVPYDAPTTAAIEASYQKNPAGSHALSLGGNPFTIQFSSMMQFNAAGLGRTVRRIAPIAHSSGSGNGINGASSAAASIQHHIAAMQLTPKKAWQLLKSVREYDAVIGFVQENLPHLPNAMASSAPYQGISLKMLFEQASIDEKAMDSVISSMLALLVAPGVSSDHSSSQDSGGEEAQLAAQPSNQPVPQYYANVKNESILHRKVLSLLGLRNLIHHGRTIFSDLQQQLFSSDPTLYGRNQGLNAMRYYTGNVVDLDTVVLDCNKQLQQINAMRAADGLRAIRTPAELFQHPDIAKMVSAQAKPVIDAFIDQLKLSPDVIARRNLQLDDLVAKGKIPVAVNNSDRGHHAVWGYNNVGVMTFHANVPNVPDIFGALLKSPYHLVAGFIMMLSQTGILPPLDLLSTDTEPAFPGGPSAANSPVAVRPEQVTKLHEALEDLFNEAVSDSCFNAKWKSIEMYLDKITAVGTIEMVIANLQSTRQDIFTVRLFDEDDDQRTKETAALLRLIDGKGVRGRDPSTNTTRVICKQDVEKWIKKTM